MWACDFEAWVHKQVNNQRLKKDTRCTELPSQHTHTRTHTRTHAHTHTRTHGLRNIQEALYKETKQAASRANCLISHADLGSYNAFKGAAETQTDEADLFSHRRKVTLSSSWIQRDRMEVEGHRSSPMAVTEHRQNQTSWPFWLTFNNKGDSILPKWPIFHQQAVCICASVCVCRNAHYTENLLHKGI